MSRQTRRIIGQAVVLACATAAVSFTTATTAHAAQPVTLSYTSPGEYAVDIPTAGVSSIRVVAVGGTGARTAANLGGRGAIVTADLPVIAGKTYYAEVGDNGHYVASGGGGGASDIRTNPGFSGLSSRLLVAAGGGGAGDVWGGDAGSPGSSAKSNDSGGAGTATAGGKGGCAPYAVCGSNGSFGVGGAGGGVGAPGGGGGANGGGPAGTDSDGIANQYGGGGGGGGWYGGGGGGSFNGDFGASAGGGGGGSNLVPSGGTVTLDTTASPQITITYNIAIPTTTTLVAVPNIAVHGVTPVTLTARVKEQLSNGSFIPPSGIGSVQFYSYDGDITLRALGAPVPLNVLGGAVKVSTLPAGTIIVLASFIPANGVPFASSSSPLVGVTVL